MLRFQQASQLLRDDHFIEIGLADIVPEIGRLKTIWFALSQVEDQIPAWRYLTLPQTRQAGSVTYTSASELFPSPPRPRISSHRSSNEASSLAEYSDRHARTMSSHGRAHTVKTAAASPDKRDHPCRWQLPILDLVVRAAVPSRLERTAFTAELNSCQLSHGSTPASLTPFPGHPGYSFRCQHRTSGCTL